MKERKKERKKEMMMKKKKLNFSWNFYSNATLRLTKKMMK